MSFFITFYKLLNSKQKINFYLMIVFSIIIIFFELLSIGLVIPLISIILDPDIFLTTFNIEGTKFFPLIENFINSGFFIYYFLIFFILLFIIKNILVFFINYYQLKFVEKIEVSFSSSMIYKYLSQKFPFFSKNNSSNLITKLSIDFLNFTRGFVQQLITITSEVLIIFAFILFIFFLDLHRIGVVFFIFFLVGAISMRIIGKLADKWGEERKYFDHLKMSLLNNTFFNIKSIIIDNKRNVVVNNFDNYIKKLASIQKKIMVVKVLPRSIFEIFAIVSLSSLIMFMTVFEYDKNYILTTTGFFIAVAYRIVPSFQKIIYSYQTISLGKVILNSIDKDLALSNQISNSNEKLPFRQNIKINNLHFKYPGRNLFVLNDLQLNINKGKSIGIFGDSGEGKSTLVDVISCLIPYDKGEIKVDDVAINNDELIRKWQNQISYVTQNTILFDDTIKNNIIFSSNSKDIDHSYLEEVIKNTQLSSFIDSLPEKVDTNVGEMGAQLSGGQIKRIGIARAYYKKPELLIFDEATNGLDKETEEKILSMIFNLKKEMTIIIISHDINVLKRADEIFKFSKGKLEKINGNN